MDNVRQACGRCQVGGGPGDGCGDGDGGLGGLLGGLLSLLALTLLLFHAVLLPRGGSHWPRRDDDGARHRRGEGDVEEEGEGEGEEGEGVGVGEVVGVGEGEGEGEGVVEGRVGGRSEFLDVLLASGAAPKCEF